LNIEKALIKITAESGVNMKKIGHFLNIAILTFFASCMILLFGGIEYRAADLMQSIDYQKPLYPLDNHEDEISPKSDYYTVPDTVIFEEKEPTIVYL
jgi:hypothetical protein